MNKITLIFFIFICFLTIIQNVEAASYSSDGQIISLSINNLRVYDLNFNSKCTVNIYGIDFSNNTVPLFEATLTFFTESINCYYYLGKDINQIHIVVNEDGHVSLDKTTTVYKNPYEFYDAQLITELYTKPFYPNEFKKITTVTDNKKKVLFFIYFLTTAMLILFRIKSKYVVVLMLFLFFVFFYLYSTIGAYDYIITIKGKASSTQFDVSQYLENEDSNKLFVIEKADKETTDYQFTSTSIYIRQGKYKLSELLSYKPIIFSVIPVIFYDETDYYLTFNKNLQWWIAHDKK